MIKNLIDIEKSYINTSHPDFLGPEQSVLNLFEESGNVQFNNNNIKNFPFSGGAGNGLNTQTYNTGNVNLGSGTLIENVNTQESNVNTNRSYNNTSSNNNYNYNYGKKDEMKYEIEDDKKKLIKPNTDPATVTNFPSQMRPSNPKNSRCYNKVRSNGQRHKRC